MLPCRLQLCGDSCASWGLQWAGGGCHGPGSALCEIPWRGLGVGRCKRGEQGVAVTPGLSSWVQLFRQMLPVVFSQPPRSHPCGRGRRQERQVSMHARAETIAKGCV